MSNRQKFVLIFCFIIIDMFLLIGFLVIRDATLLNDLKKEIAYLEKLDITLDRYNLPIKSSGGYAIVEKSIKEYLDSHALLLQDILDMMRDEKLLTILSYTNYSTDGPDFKKSIAYLEKAKADFNKDINLLIADFDEEKIKGYINTKTQDPYYQDLYVDLMLNDNMRESFLTTVNLLEKTKIKINNVFDVSREVIDFLILNKEAWKVEDGEIKFLTEDLYNNYNFLISKIKVN